MDLLCSLIFMPSDTEIEQTTCTFSRSIRANDLGKSGGGDNIIGAYRAGKVHVVCSTLGLGPRLH